MDVSAIHLKNISEVVSIHKAAFNGFFLTELGDDFLFLYYKSVMKHQNGILLGCFDDGRLCGFCAATVLSRGFNKRLIKSDFSHYSLIGMKLAFTKPKAIIRLIRNFSKEEASNSDDGSYAELLSIGVDPDCQGKGVGRMLLTALEDEIKERKALSLSLTTDYDNNKKTVSFYKSLGYSVWYDFVTYPNRHMYRMIKSLDK